MKKTRSSEGKNERLTPSQVKAVEKRLIELGKSKHQLDDKTARQWARRMAVA